MSMQKVVFISSEKTRKSLSRVTSWTGRFGFFRFASVESISRSGPFGGPSSGRTFFPLIRAFFRLAHSLILSRFDSSAQMRSYIFSTSRSRLPLFGIQQSSSSFLNLLWDMYFRWRITDMGKEAFLSTSRNSYFKIISFITMSQTFNFLLAWHQSRYLLVWGNV